MHQAAAHGRFRLDLLLSCLAVFASTSSSHAWHGGPHARLPPQRRRRERAVAVVGLVFFADVARAAVDGNAFVLVGAVAVVVGLSRGLRAAVGQQPAQQAVGPPPLIGRSPHAARAAAALGGLLLLARAGAIDWLRVAERQDRLDALHEPLHEVAPAAAVAATGGGGGIKSLSHAWAATSLTVRRLAGSMASMPSSSSHSECESTHGLLYWRKTVSVVLSPACCALATARKQASRLSARSKAKKPEAREKRMIPIDQTSNAWPE
mmetsp:Transcript_53566/g.158565  ORF Transcript_53566/g.158565 Transcript_53566/m.158565 type:complete len:264 (-) Transcript_53566:642-1433(-)